MNFVQSSFFSIKKKEKEEEEEEDEEKGKEKGKRKKKEKIPHKDLMGFTQSFQLFPSD